MRHRAFPGRGPDVMARYERAGHWIFAAIYENERSFKWLKDHDVPAHKAQGEGINSAGGFVVPSELSNAIMDLRDYYGAFRRRARIVPMGTGRVAAPRRAGFQTPTNTFFMGENTSAQENQVKIDSMIMTARKLGTLVRLSTELVEDSFVDVVDYVANEVALAFAAQEDDCAFNGTGAVTYGGMMGIATIASDGGHSKAKVTAAGGHNTYVSLDTTDLGNLMGSVRASALPNAAFFASVAAFGATFSRLAAGYLPYSVVDGIVTYYYSGFPIILTQKLPLIFTSITGQLMMVFGDMYAGAALGQRRGITIARSAERYMDQDQLAILATERIHCVVHDMGDNTNFGSLAALFAP